MEHSRKGYVRCGDYVEVRVPKAASYSYVVSCALEVLDVEEDEEEKGEGKPSMFRIDGTIVPDSPIVCWTNQTWCWILLWGKCIIITN